MALSACIGKRQTAASASAQLGPAPLALLGLSTDSGKSLCKGLCWLLGLCSTLLSLACRLSLGAACLEVLPRAGALCCLAGLGMRAGSFCEEVGLFRRLE